MSDRIDLGPNPFPEHWGDTWLYPLLIIGVGLAGVGVLLAWWMGVL